MAAADRLARPRVKIGAATGIARRDAAALRLHFTPIEGRLCATVTA
jgi:hypothetical protein